jgi:hypothetical protein
MAVTEYTEKNFFELTGKQIRTFSFLKLFNILLDEDRETKFMNIFRSYIVNENVFTETAFYNTYQVSNGDFWDNISYKLYNSPYIWWMLAIINNTVNPFEELEDGQIIKVLREDFVYTVVKDLERIAEQKT